MTSNRQHSGQFLDYDFFGYGSFEQKTNKLSQLVFFARLDHISAVGF